MRRIICLVVVAATCAAALTACAKVADSLREDFSSLDSTKWVAIKGSPRAENGKLILHSSPGAGAELQSMGGFEYCTLEVKVSSQNAWPVDSTVGLELWREDGHYGIVVGNGGNLGVLNPSKGSSSEWYGKIPGWDRLEKNQNTLKLVWTRKRIDLFVNGKHALTYDGPIIPTIPLKVRLNSSNDHADRLTVDYVRVSSK